MHLFYLPHVGELDFHIEGQAVLARGSSHLGEQLKADTGFEKATFLGAWRFQSRKLLIVPVNQI